jgi:hypothetical protein
MPPLGTAGLRTMSPAQEEIIFAAMRGGMTERALYLMPSIDFRKPLTAQEKQARIDRFAVGPTAVVAFSPRPADRALGGSLLAGFITIELVFDILAALIGAIVAFHLSPALGYWPRVALLAAIGLLATIDIDGSYWNWYGFPTPYLLVQFADHVGGWCLAGLILARRR